MSQNLSGVESRLQSALMHVQRRGIRIRNFFPRLAVAQNQFHHTSAYGETDLVGALILSEGLRPKDAVQNLGEGSSSALAFATVSAELGLMSEEMEKLILSFDMGHDLGGEYSEMGKRLRAF